MTYKGVMCVAIHVVQPGDSLWVISRLYDIPIQTLQRINGIDRVNMLVPGLALYIPDSGPGVFYYRVTASDTFWIISQRFNTSIEGILAVNPGIDPSQLFVGQRIAIPSPSKRTIQTLGYLVPYSVEQALKLVQGYAEHLTYVALVAYSLTDEGYIVRLLEDEAVINESRRLGLSPLLMIRNIEFVGETFNAELIGTVLANPVYRQNLIRSLVKTIKDKSYSGVSIDFEFVPPGQRNEFNLFFKELKAGLGEDLVLHVNVHAKTADIPTNRIVGAYDYQSIGQYADIVAVMTMDYGYPTGPPDPIAPLWWMQEVIEYTLSLINPQKVQIAFPLYSYDWKVPENITQATSVLGAQNLAISTGAKIQFDYQAASPWFSYISGTEQHIVWFEDIRSFIEKYSLVDIYQLLGVTYWQMGLEFPQNWAFLGRDFTVVKR